MKEKFFGFNQCTELKNFIKSLKRRNIRYKLHTIPCVGYTLEVQCL
jgi:hypothetical protein